MFIERYVKPLICLIAHTVIYFIPFKANKHYDVVIVRSDAIGDFIIWLSTMNSYKKRFKGKSVLLICPSINKSIAIDTGCFSEVITFDRDKIVNNIRYHISYMKMLKTLSADLVLNPAWGHQFSADYICAMIKSPQKIGTIVKRHITVKNYVDNIIAKLIDIGIGDFGNLYFTDLIPMPDQHTSSEFEAIESFTRQIVDSDFRYNLANMSFLTKDYVKKISGEYCFISVSSSRIIKDWPNERLAELICDIPDFYTIVLSGFGTSDLEKADFLIQSDNGKHEMLNYVNKTSVKEMICLISKATFVLGNDSAAVHIAAACRVPSICFTHGAHFGRFVPYPDYIPEKEFHPRCVYKKMECFGCSYRCGFDFDINKPFFCLRQVTVDMAKKELLELLKYLH